MLKTIQPYRDNEQAISSNGMECRNIPNMLNLSRINLVTSNPQSAQTETHEERNHSTLTNKTFPELPEVIIEQIIEYLDIPSISNICQTCKQTSNSLFSTLVMDDKKIWGRLIQTRFNIGNLNHKRSKAYGGATWKLAYQSLLCANRIPKCRLLTGKGKTIFAKPVFHESVRDSDDDLRNSNENFYRRSKHKDRKRIIGENISGLSLWVSVGHTPDCNTRFTRRQNWNPMEEYEDNRQYQRFIELHLCIQNTKSSNGCVHVDFSESFVQQIGSSHEAKICNVHANKYGKHKPKILYYSGDGKVNKSGGYHRGNTNRSMRHKKHAYQQKYCVSSNYRIVYSEDGTMTTNVEGNSTKKYKETKQNQISLHPFEFAIIAVNLPCTDDMIYETDFLSRSLMVHIPVKVDCYKPTRRLPKSKSELDDCNYNLNWTKEIQDTLVTASFMNEMQIWEHYMQLPGGCLALVDTSNSYVG